MRYQKLLINSCGSACTPRAILASVADISYQKKKRIQVRIRKHNQVRNRVFIQHREMDQISGIKLASQCRYKEMQKISMARRLL